MVTIGKQDEGIRTTFSQQYNHYKVSPLQDNI